MRFRVRVVITLAIAACLVVGAWGYLNWDRLARRWATRGVASAASFDAAGSAIAAMEKAPGREASLRELTSKWGTGDSQFDLSLAWYVGKPKSSEFLRQTFSLEFGWREDLLPRWAHYWTWRAAQEPDQEIAAVLAFFDLLASSATPRTVTWREVLDLQAVFVLAGQPRLAVRLSPENWLARYQTWRKAHPGAIPHVTRPAAPFPDWREPVPDRKRLAGQ